MLLILAGVFVLLAGAEPARVLGFFPLPAKSHHFAYRGILEGLAIKGHQVVYVTAIPYEEVPPNITQVSIDDTVPNIGEFLDPVEFGEFTLIENINYWYGKFGIETALGSLRNPKVQRLIHSTDEKFNVVIFESQMAQEYAVAWTHKFGAIGVEVTALGDCAILNEFTGVPDNPAWMVDWRTGLTNSLSFWQRVYNYYFSSVVVLGAYWWMPTYQRLADEHFNYTGWGERPSLLSLLANRSLVLSNSDSGAIGAGVVPLAPHHKEVGGLHIRPNHPLPKDMQEFMDDSKEGVIFMSLGSIVNMSDVTQGGMDDIFMEVFSELPYSVMVKYEPGNGRTLPKNVRAYNWFPQQDVLAHKKCIMFISHAGFLSISESVFHSVPLLVIPFFADQVKNAVMLQEAGYGRVLAYRNITLESVRWSINEVLKNPRYKNEVVKRSILLKDKRHSPVGEAVYWIEYVIRYPNILKSKGTQLTYIQRHLLDVKFFLLSVLLVLGYLLCTSLRSVKKLFWTRLVRRSNIKAKRS